MRHGHNLGPRLLGQELRVAWIIVRRRQNNTNFFRLHGLHESLQMPGRGRDAWFRFHEPTQGEPETLGEVGPEIMVRHRLGASIGQKSPKPATQEMRLMLALEECGQPAVFEEQSELRDIVLLGQRFADQRGPQALPKSRVALRKGGLLRRP